MKYAFFLFSILIITNCNSTQKGVDQNNPPAVGFDQANSDDQAIDIADEVMEAMGGRQNYDKTRYIKFTFKNERVHIWDKKTGNIRIDYLEEDKSILMNVHTMKGKAMLSDTLINSDHPKMEALAQAGKEHWINDTYWLVMPFKLKDSGVTLKYVKEGITQEGTRADILSMTFKNVGVTPNNKYLVYVDKESRLVVQWDFYTNATDKQPLFSTPWEGYVQHGLVKLSGGRGGKGLTDIEVLDVLPNGILMKF